MTKGLFQVSPSEYRGPRAGFTDAHVLRTLILIGENESIGRGKLGQLLDIGQGEVRTLIKRLRERGWIAVGEEGCTLTKDGEERFKVLSRMIPWRGRVNGSPLQLGKDCFALLVRGRSTKVRKGIEQRDAAIKAGASAALTVIYSDGKFMIPSERTDCESDGPSEPWTTIRSAAKPKDGDTIIIAGADDAVASEHSGLAAALDLIQQE